MDEAPRTNLIALRDARQRAEALITTRYAEGVIDDDALDTRLERLNAADSVAAIDELIADLVDPATAPTVALVPVGNASMLEHGAAHARLRQIPDERAVTAVFASVEQHGQWVPGRRTRVVDVFASARLDLREAVLGPGPTLIEINCVFASLEMIVPPELAVRVEARLLFSSLERDAGIREQPRSADEPLVIITGLVLFANFELRERLVGESGRQARRRHKALRKAAKRRAALPEGRS